MFVFKYNKGYQSAYIFMTPRNKKQAIIGSVCVIIVSIVSFWVYASFLKAPETCSDGLMNQNETMIDCGGVCGGSCQEQVAALPMQIMETSFIYVDPGHSDVLVKVYNPNDAYGSSNLSYTVSLKDAQGNIVGQKTDTSFVLPKETKYLMQVSVETRAAAVSADVSIDAVDWKLLSAYQEKPVLNIGFKRYGPVSSGVGFGQVDGTLSNESGFDFQTIRVMVVLRDVNKKPIAINKTEMRTVIAGDRRDFRLIWPTYFAGEVNSVEAEPEADVYRSDNFVRKYLPGGAFQQL